ncbi:50S ribosomal protein L15 [Capsaspora owczarzaki ATCC 30864]|uniref:50S ribosomal protein L15 n=1 Tax=Capsaspora owczarzaki (strain ATCC 30864) TaxID=595528 RepID=A0A0D2UFJ9_CAPO3|nr:50S ribosomal protein L15 [Capsaspora owczarzaki ATCC 30864]
MSSVVVNLGRKPLSAKSLASLPRITLTSLKPIAGTNKERKRIGRGPGSGFGKNGGTGDAGQNKKEGHSRPGFEGGAMPFYRKVPKQSPVLAEVNIHQISKLIQTGFIKPSEPITIKTLHDVGLVKDFQNGVKLLATGAASLRSPIEIAVTRASEAAVASIERAGGKVTTVFYNQRGLRGLVHPERFEPTPPPSGFPVKNKHIQYYKNAQHRGQYAPALQLAQARRSIAKA